jgi:hypothetical protein
MKNVSRRLLVLAMLAAPSLTLAAGGPGGPVKGYFLIDGIQGPSKDAQHQQWFEMWRHEISVEDGIAPQCVVTVDVYALYAAPAFVHKVGDTIPEIKLELATPNFGYQYRALIHDAVIRRVNTSSVTGAQTEKIELRPASMDIMTKKIKADGTLTPGGQTHVDCAPYGRS